MSKDLSLVMLLVSIASLELVFAESVDQEDRAGKLYLPCRVEGESKVALRYAKA